MPKFNPSGMIKCLRSMKNIIRYNRNKTDKKIIVADNLSKIHLINLTSIH